MERAFAEINLSRLRHNIAKIKNELRPHTRLMAVVKADGYGHGAVAVAKSAVAENVDYLGVAWWGEAEELRKAGLKAPILLLSEPATNYAERVIAYNLTQTVYTSSYIDSLAQAAQKVAKKAKVHLKIDTGMSRIGVEPEQAVRLAKLIKSHPSLELEGVFTHFSCADDLDNPHTAVQFARFKKVLRDLAEEGIAVPLQHAANSAATKNFPETQLDMVRIGLAMYQGALAFKSRVTYVKRVPARTPVSYGACYRTPQETGLATLSVGYADGYSRRLSGRGVVLIGKKKYLVVGTVCMDMLVVDIGDDQVSVGAEALLMGQSASGQIDISEIAEKTEMIEYEVLCGIGKRVPRLYFKE